MIMQMLISFVYFRIEQNNDHKRIMRKYNYVAPLSGINWNINYYH